ncbi:hypothetical protein ACLKA6_013949 [Drosophila palustris]
MTFARSLLHLTWLLMRKCWSQPPSLEIQHRPEVKYLGKIIDRRLTWKPHILRTCATVRAKCKKLDWLFRPRSGLSLTAKVRLFKAIISPTLTWGVNIWGTACNSSIKKMETCQSKILRRIVDSPWYVRDVTVYRDQHQGPSLCTTVNRFAERYRAWLVANSNCLAIGLANLPGEGGQEAHLR